MDEGLSTGWLVVFGIVAVWELAWKGMALWKAGKKQDKIWFVLLLVINTAGLLSIVYLLMNKNKD